MLSALARRRSATGREGPTLPRLLRPLAPRLHAAAAGVTAQGEVISSLNLRWHHALALTVTAHRVGDYGAARDVVVLDQS